MDEKTRRKSEVVALSGMLEHLQCRTEVQNIDPMNLAGFCLSGLSKS